MSEEEIVKNIQADNEHLEQAIEQETKKHHVLETRLRELRARNHNETQLLQYERKALQSIPSTWFVLILMHLYFSNVAFGRWSVLWYIANIIMLLIQLRRIYRKDLPGSMVASITVIACTFLLM